MKALFRFVCFMSMFFATIFAYASWLVWAMKAQPEMKLETIMTSFWFWFAMLCLSGTIVTLLSVYMGIYVPRQYPQNTTPQPPRPRKKLPVSLRVIDGKRAA